MLFARRAERFSVPIRVDTILRNKVGDSVETSEALDAAINVLLSGKQSYDSFEYLAEYFAAYADNPKQINPQAIKWIALALNKIAVGESPEQALGIKRKVGREKKDFKLLMKVSACMELSKRGGLKKTNAIQAAAEFLHKDPRHIQRILANEIQIDLSEMDTKALNTLASKGIDMRFLLPNDELRLMT